MPLLTETILALVFKGKADSNLRNKWENVSTTMTQDKSLQTVDLTYKFPDGITCNNKVFNNNKKGNPPADDFHIVSKFHVFTFTEKVGTNKTGTDINQSIPFFVWEMAVENEEQQNPHTKLEQEEEEDDDLANAFASMAAIKIKSTGK
jgi:hypothetical protein